MTPTLVTAEQLLWGLRDRDQGWALAELLALEVVSEAATHEASGDPATLFASGALTEAQEDPQRAAQIYQTAAGPLLKELAVGVDWHLAQLGLKEQRLAGAVFRAGQLRQRKVTQLRQQWLRDPENPQSGIACGSYLRPEALFSHRTQTVVCLARDHANPTGLEEVQVGKLKVVSLDQFFLDRSQVVLGFGNPNVFTLIPPEASAPQNVYQKLDAFMFYRKKTRVTWASVAQSGVYIRLRKLPPEAIERLRAAMQQQQGKRAFSCAQANATALTLAGFTSGGEPLSHLLRPQALFTQIIEKGLEFRGEPLVWDILNTTPVTIEDHFQRVLEKERRSPLSFLEKVCNAGQKTAAEVESLQLARALKKVETPLIPVLAGSPVRIRNSRPSELGMGLRQLWGQHILWEALPDPDKIDINRYLPEVLLDKFSLAELQGRKLSRVDRLKSMVFSKPMVASIRSSMAGFFDEMGAYQPGQIKAMIPAAPMGDPPVVFNLVICGPKQQSRISITRIEVEKKAPDWVLSKHVLISAYDPDVRFAGEVWAERFIAPDQSEQLRFHLNNNSGTYHPSVEQLDGAVAYLQELFPGVELQAHPMGAPAPATARDYQKTYQVPASQFESLKRALNGQQLNLLGETFTIRAIHEIELESEYLDTPDRQLERAGAILRARTRYHKPGQIKEIELEAKIPGENGTARTKGASFDCAQAWAAHRQEILQGHDDPAVQLARTIAGPQAQFEPLSWKRTKRLLLGVAAKKPLGLGWLQPSFILSLDTSSSPQSPMWHVLEPQIFTKLPWLKTITPRRLEQFEELCRQLARLHQLEPQKG